MIKLDANILGRLGSQSFNNQKQSSQVQTKQAHVTANQLSGVQFTRHDVKGFALFHRSVSHSVNLAMPPSQKDGQHDYSEQEIAEQEERAELAANNILSFIQRRIKQDVAEGASQEQLESRFSAALQGFNEGYEEASSILEDLNLLTPKVEQDIQLTREKVLAGLDSMKQAVFGVEPETVAESQNDSTVVAPSEQEDAVQYSSMTVAQGSGFEFELTTQEGDTVRIRASNTMAFQRDRHISSRGSIEASSGLAEGYFQLAVNGELDQGELEAINALLNKVEELSTDFYAGDLGQAYKKALELGYDNNEISEFALSLSQTRHVQMMQAYQPEQGILKPNVVTELKPLGRFASALSQSLTMANDAFSHPRELLGDLFRQIDRLHQTRFEGRAHEPMGPLTEQLIDRLSQLQGIE